MEMYSVGATYLNTSGESIDWPIGHFKSYIFPSAYGHAFQHN